MSTINLPQNIVAFNGNIDFTEQIVIRDGDAFGYRSKCEGKAISLYRNGELFADGVMSLTNADIGYILPSICGAELTYHDETFEKFSRDDTYTVVLGGEEPINMAFCDGKSLFTQEMYNGLAPFILGIDNNWYAAGNAQTFSIAQNVQTTRKKYDIKLLPEECLPKSVAKKSEVKSVERVAQSAQSTSNNALSTSNNALSAVNTLTRQFFVSYTFNNEGNVPKIQLNDTYFYKIGELPKNLYSSNFIIITILNSGTTNSIHANAGSTGCEVYGNNNDVVIVKDFGKQCIGKFYGVEKLQGFTPSSTGIYVRNWDQASASGRVTKVDFYYNGLYLVQGRDSSLFLASSTPNSTKQFKITVDDTGTISATEVTA